MPFKSAKQRKYMWANHPTIARRWEHEEGKKVKLRTPKHASSKKS